MEQMKILPILFNTDMVQAILDGRKTVTRRAIKPQPRGSQIHKLGFCVDGNKRDIGKFGFGSHEHGGHVLYVKPPYKQGDILYVRETWNFVYNMDDSDQIIGNTGRYIYYADDPMPFSHWVDSDTGEHKEKMPWKPSIHMPKEGARIWLKVTDVRVERLQEIDCKGAYNEGAGLKSVFQIGGRVCEFAKLWNSTIKKKDLPLYGWEANPWVWAIEFERCDKPEGID